MGFFLKGLKNIKNILYLFYNIFLKSTKYKKKLTTIFFNRTRQTKNRAVVAERSKALCQWSTLLTAKITASWRHNAITNGTNQISLTMAIQQQYQPFPSICLCYDQIVFEKDRQMLLLVVVRGVFFYFSVKLIYI